MECFVAADVNFVRLLLSTDGDANNEGVFFVACRRRGLYNLEGHGGPVVQIP